MKLTASSRPQAIVLAAGSGQRMRPLSERTHKALLPIGETTVLARIIDGLSEAGADPITVVTGYRAREIRDAVLARQVNATISFVNNAEYATTNNIVSLARALEQVDADQDVVLVECDLVLEQRLLDGICQESDGNVALVDRYGTGMDGTVVRVREGVVTQVVTPGEQGADFNYGDAFKTLNVHRFGSRFCQGTLRPLLDWYIREYGPTAYYEMVLGMLTGHPSPPIAAELVEPGSWAEIDDPNDLAVARFRFDPGSRAELLDRTSGGHWGLGMLDFAHMRNVRFPPPGMIAALRHALPDLLASKRSKQDRSSMSPVSWGIDVQTGTLAGSTIQSQTRQALVNCRSVPQSLASRSPTW